MSVFCDVCTKALAPGRAYYYGGGAYCEEHVPEDAETHCGECGAHLEYFQATTSTESTALEIVTACETDAVKIIDGLDALAIGHVRAYISKLAEKSVGMVQIIDAELAKQHAERVVKSVTVQAEELGRIAFGNDLTRAPYLDPAVQGMLKAKGYDWTTAICEHWLRGWDKANLRSGDATLQDLLA